MGRIEAFAQWVVIIAVPYGLWVVYTESGTWFIKFWAALGILTVALKAVEFRCNANRVAQLPPL